MYKSIKQLVIDETRRLNGLFPSKNNLRTKVLQHFPDSKWKDTHYAWYKSKIKKGEISIGLEVADDQKTDEKPEENTNKDFSLSLERDLQSYLLSSLDDIEDGLELCDEGIEFKTDAGYIDILAKDINNNYVVIELKAGKAKDSAIGQTLGYIGAIAEMKETKNVRGIIIASDFEDRLYFAVKSISNLILFKYNLSFNFDRIV